MEALRIRKHVDSQTLNMPELLAFVGQDVEIVVNTVEGHEAADNDDTDWKEDYPLRGSLLWYDDPFGPATPIEDWEALQ